LLPPLISIYHQSRFSQRAFFIDIIFLPVAAFSLFAVYKGVSAMWNKMSEMMEVNADYRPSVKQFTLEFLWPAIKETVQHKRFNECGTNVDRVKGHLPLLLAFMGLLVVTTYSFVRKDFLGLIYPSLHGPIPFYDPFKLLANISAIALLVGIAILWANRKKNYSQGCSTGSSDCNSFAERRNDR